MKMIKPNCALLLLFFTLSHLHAQSDLLIADFEGQTYGDWVTTGEAFGPGPAHGALPGQMHVDGFLGKGLVNSFYHGDASTGTLTSPPFKVERRYIQFLIGGGKNPGETCINLLEDGKVVRTASGPNGAPGGSETLDSEQWDVSDLSGKTVTLQIVDKATGGWGHINVDQIIQTDKRLPGWVSNAKRDITIQKRYLNLPVKNGAPKRLVSLDRAGKTERQFEIELADSEPDWWSFIDVSPFQGQSLTIKVDKLKEDSAALNSIEQSDEIKSADTLYQEKLRPQFHFTSRRGWNNDPNGLFFYNGQYHLFYQHNPYGWSWGNMHWGHAASSDLLHWRELGEALYPDEQGTMFSGSAVVDSQNTSGFQKGTEKPIILFYTAAGGTSEQSKGQPFTQCIAYSVDGGHNWTKYEKNPVLKHVAGGNRDPKVVWYEPKKLWLMALYLDGNDFAIFSSPNLKAWERLCDVKLPGDSECPEFFEMPLQGTQGQTRWIFHGGKGSYLVGQFDGSKFTPESGPHRLNYGNCFYASQSYTDLPDGRRIMIGWGQVALPGMPFNQMMDLPIELTLRNTEEGTRIFAAPIAEIKSLHGATQTVKDKEVPSGEILVAANTGELLDIKAELEPGNAQEVGLKIRGVSVAYDPNQQLLTCLNQKAPLKPMEGKLRLRILVDRASIEIFANDGRVYMPNGVLFKEDERSIRVYTKGAAARINSIDVTELKSVWNNGVN
jgi:fructan beta-fructosidase